MKGRKPKTTRRQISEGDPSKHGVNKLAAKLAAEPKPTYGLPDCPRHLTGRARVAWHFWAPELVEMNIDRRPDAMMLEGACVSYQRATQADEILQKEGLVLVVDTIDPATKQPIQKLKAHPATSISNAAWSQVRAFCSEFGLSPVSRTRLSVDRQEKTESLAEILSRPREPKPASTVQ